MQPSRDPLDFQFSVTTESASKDALVSSADTVSLAPQQDETAKGVNNPPANPAAPIDPADVADGARVMWVILFLVGILFARYAVPYLLEEMTRAVVRGRQRAEYEIASQYLNEVSFEAVSKAYQMVSHRVAPSVVHINAVQGPPLSRRDESAFMFGGNRPPQDQGSGVILSEDGFIMTNCHVVMSGRDITVTLSDGRVLPAEVIGTDVLTDLAVIQVHADKLIAADWGDSDRLEVGALVWAAGSPFGLQSTVTSGILSAKNRAEFAGTPYQDFLQTDAAVNPGNSGGPLVDSSGRVIGINTAIIGESYQGISFAVPSSIAKDVYNRLLTDGQVDRGYLGIRMEEINSDVREQYKLTTNHGAVVMEVFPRTPAAHAGIQRGDVIVRWNGEDIRNPTDVSRLVAKTKVQSSAAVTVLREGRALVLRAVIGRRRSD